MSRAASNNVRGPSSALTEFLRVRDSALYFSIHFTQGRNPGSLPEQLRVAPRRGHRIDKDRDLRQDPVNFQITIIGMVKGLRMWLKPLGIHQGGGIELQVSDSSHIH